MGTWKRPALRVPFTATAILQTTGGQDAYLQWSSPSKATCLLPRHDWRNTEAFIKHTIVAEARLRNMKSFRMGFRGKRVHSCDLRGAEERLHMSNESQSFIYIYIYIEVYFLLWMLMRTSPSPLEHNSGIIHKPVGRDFEVRWRRSLTSAATVIL